MRTGRIDYRVQRRAVLRDVVAGTRARDDVCDAHPELLRAAGHLGRLVDEPCALCQGELRHVTYIFDSDPRNPGGRAVAHDSLAAQFDRRGDLKVFVVEVCLRCAWHHLVESFMMTPRSHASLG